MDSTGRAVIDVGTNSIKLLVADVLGQEVIPVVEKSEQTRLGRGFYTNHQLQPDAIAATAIAERLKVGGYRTSVLISEVVKSKPFLMKSGENR